MGKKIYFAWMLAVVFALAGCEDLEDTYSDYAGDGMVRYVGKCKDVTVTPGWERLHVEWKNSLDPGIESIKVVCVAGDIVRDTVLEAGVTSCDIRNMEDGSYQVNVYAVGEGGRLSLSDAESARPYTSLHEEVRSFSPGIIKHFFVENNLVLFMDKWSENFVNFELNYTRADGNVEVLPLTQEMFAEKYCLLEGINTNEKIFITREGRVDGCLDLIPLEPYVLTTDPVFTSSFRGWLKERYRLEEISEDFLKTKSLQFDYDILTLEDILYFPDLEEIELGKNRYLYEAALSVYPNEWCSVLTELEKGEFVLGVAQKLRGLKINRYHKHYFPGTTTLQINEMGIPTLPGDINYLPTAGWTISHSQEGNVMEQYPLRNLLDNLFVTFWMPRAHTVLLTYDIIIDMQAEQVVNGIKIAQAGMANVMGFIPGTVQIETSHNGYDWEMFTHMQNNTLGNGLGESTLYRSPEPKQARYIKVVVSDQVNGVMNISLGDIAVF